MGGGDMGSWVRTPGRLGRLENPRLLVQAGLLVESREPALREEQRHCVPIRGAGPPNAPPKPSKLFPWPLLESIKLEEEPNRS